MEIAEDPNHGCLREERKNWQESLKSTEGRGGLASGRAESRSSLPPPCSGLCLLIGLSQESLFWLLQGGKFLLV